MKKVGIMGGTFDPPHLGHLLMANDVARKMSLDEVWFMPNQIPPHKEANYITSAEVRVQLLEAAIETNPLFRVETMELKREGPSYTYDTILLVKEQYPNTEFYFIIGADMVEYLPKWYKIKDLVELVTFIGVKRPGFSIKSDYPVIEVETPEFDVSSTMIRQRIKDGLSSQYLVPDKVKTIIEEKNLYE